MKKIGKSWISYGAGIEWWWSCCIGMDVKMLVFPSLFLRSASKIIVFFRFWDDFCLGSDGLLEFSVVFLRCLMHFIDFYVFSCWFLQHFINKC